MIPGKGHVKLRRRDKRKQRYLLYGGQRNSLLYSVYEAAKTSSLGPLTASLERTQEEIAH